MKKTYYNNRRGGRRRVKRHEEILQNWHIGHLDERDPDFERKRKLISVLSKEADFNDDFVTSIVTDETNLLCFQI